jgi:hypothetical protein
MFASDITDERRTLLLNKIAQKIIDYRLTTVAIVMLESSKPLSFVGSQLMVFLQPFYRAIFPHVEYDEIAALLEERKNIERLIQEVERLEDERNKKK